MLTHQHVAQIVQLLSIPVPVVISFCLYLLIAEE